MYARLPRKDRVPIFGSLPFEFLFSTLLSFPTLGPAFLAVCFLVAGAISMGFGFGLCVEWVQHQPAMTSE